MAKLHKCIDKSNIKITFNKNINDRYSICLSRVSAKTNNIAVVILKNPASSFKSAIFYNNIPFGNVYDIDKTTNIVIDFLDKQQEDYEKIILLNIFPYFDNIPKVINNIYYEMKNNMPNESFSRNLKEINNIFQNSNIDLYCAWGKNSGIDKKIYDNAISNLINLINSNSFTNIYEVNHFIRRQYLPSITQYPKHGLYWK